MNEQQFIRVNKSPTWVSLDRFPIGTIITVEDYIPGSKIVHASETGMLWPMSDLDPYPKIPMLTRKDIKKGSRVQCVTLHSTTHPELGQYLENEGVRRGEIYTIDLINEFDEHISCEGFKKNKWIPLDLFQLVDTTGPAAASPAYRPLAVGDRFRANFALANRHGDIQVGEIVTVSMLHRSETGFGFLLGKGEYCYRLLNTRDFERVDNRQELQDLLARLKKVPDPKLSPLDASKALGSLIDDLEDELNPLSLSNYATAI